LPAPPPRRARLPAGRARCRGGMASKGTADPRRPICGGGFTAETTGTGEVTGKGGRSGGPLVLRGSVPPCSPCLRGKGRSPRSAGAGRKISRRAAGGGVAAMVTRPNSASVGGLRGRLRRRVAFCHTISAYLPRIFRKLFSGARKLQPPTGLRLHFFAFGPDKYRAKHDHKGSSRSPRPGGQEGACTLRLTCSHAKVRRAARSDAARPLGSVARSRAGRSHASLREAVAAENPSFKTVRQRGHAAASRSAASPCQSPASHPALHMHCRDWLGGAGGGARSCTTVRLLTEPPIPPCSFTDGGGWEPAKPANGRDE
jgi:hypothetical protein